MKNFKFALGVLLLCAAASHARVVNNPSASTPDAWCVYGGSGYSDGTVAGAEDCVDYSGNFLPTVTNAQTLGTASLVWSNAYLQAATISGSNTAGTAGVTPVTGVGGTAATVSSVLGIQAYPSYQVGSGDGVGQGVVASTTIPVNATYERLIGVGNITLTSTPSISTSTVVGGTTLLADGTYLILTSSATVADQVVFQSSGTLAGSQLGLGAITRAVYLGHVLTLIFNAAQKSWIEISYH